MTSDRSSQPRFKQALHALPQDLLFRMLQFWTPARNNVNRKRAKRGKLSSVLMFSAGPGVRRFVAANVGMILAEETTSPDASRNRDRRQRRGLSVDCWDWPVALSSNSDERVVPAFSNAAAE
jgi:hypothetical protein